MSVFRTASTVGDAVTEVTKRDLRIHHSAARHARSAEDRKIQDDAVRANLRAVIHEWRPTTVAAYVPMIGEPGGPDLVASLSAQVKRILLPVLLDDFDLDWAVYEGYLAPASRGLVEPDGPRLGVSALATADLVIVPGLAASADGVRLGRGGGSYDRALARVRPITPVLMLLYDGEMVSSLPVDPHDQPVSGVITPKGLHMFPRASSL